MPRPTRAQGRPGTSVIPANWGRDHAPVVRKTCTATIAIYPPPDPTTVPQLTADYTVAEPATAAAVYQGAARVQVLNGQESATLVADQDQVTVGYLVVIDRDDTDDIAYGSTVQVTASSDPSLLGARRLTVRKIARGSERFERDLWCVDDITRI